VRVYGPPDMRARGGTVTFNVIAQSGHAIPCTHVEARARDAGVAVRAGCFCNPGAAEAAFAFPPAVAEACLDRARRSGFTLAEFSECMGEDVAVGAVRASVGPANTEQDVERAIEVVASLFS
jgi:selenocysteine lyase/cysteine desulfurase